jgi:hypothetical protein
MMNANGENLLIAVALIYMRRGATLLAGPAFSKVSGLLAGFRNNLTITQPVILADLIGDFVNVFPENYGVWYVHSLTSYHDAILVGKFERLL